MIDGEKGESPETDSEPSSTPLIGNRRLSRRALVTYGGRTALMLATGSALGRFSGQATAVRRRSALEELAAAVSGPVVVPDEAAYRQAKLLYNPSFDDARPRAVVYCLTPRDVVATVNFARQRGIPFATRSGGHSFGGYSAPDGGIVADVSRMHRIRLDRFQKTAVVGPGVRLIDMYAGLDPFGLTIPGGTCPTVGVGGLTLGGGFGYSSRALGLTSDSLLELELITASGEHLTCNVDQYPDLFWACRGGGGGNFGIATSFRFGLHAVDKVAVYKLAWHWSDAPAVVDAWQRWTPEMPDSLFSTCELSRAGGRQPSAPTVTSQGQYFGTPAELAALVQPLIAAALPTSRRVAPVSFHEAQQMWMGCQPGTCYARAQNPYTVKTDFFTEPLPEAGIAAITGELESWPGSMAAQPTVGVELNSWGGAIGTVPSSATAFVHRDAHMLAIYDTTWSEHDSAALVAANRAWLEGLYARMRPFASGYAYQNLIDPQLATWPHAYYGTNLDELMSVKRRYDPGDFFHFAQGIPLSL
jgi:FAD/FMN-containing dehydrogenase